MLEEKVVNYLTRKNVSLLGSSILVGVSGGPDSLSLLHFLWEKEEEWKIKVYAGHVDHMFRGEESLQEAEFVKVFCEQRDIPFLLERVNVPEYIKKTGTSSQLAARECRYQFYERVMKEYKLDFLALGHHADDQMETILMRLTRGSTGKARVGIPFSRSFSTGFIIRPFLCLERDEIEEYCIIHNLQPRRDPSNEKGIYSRNRFRKHILPFLKKENKQVAMHFKRFSEELEEDEVYLRSLAEEKLPLLVTQKSGNEVVMDISAFLSIAIPLQRRCIQLILNYLYQEMPASLSALHIERIIELLKSPHSSGNIDLPNGLKVKKSYQFLHFQLNFNPNEPFCYEISKMGELLLPNGYNIKVEYINSEYETNRNCILLDLASVSFPLIVRSKKDGDRMSWKGLKGSKKVSRIFIDEKVPIQERESWPIITDSNGDILWVPGLKKSIHSHSNTNSGSNLLITYKKQ
ncbi:tRNA lysidine(34) synthetase TilS [Bacillus sp. B1-b2]|uniref:tRNA lysidine(34) synthetase TilS n=1 Tax=Bacillus sp. B1-b2 TaxID=2653201 RepID=UPI0012626EF4|nr:tRNA lysidine(34) synthetase TilS [Bacillus sp. B1-b2]KAB7664963.1 tRNA lysidine(34) synthetase TilS [Bacillus sp. B1-b2]